MGTIPKIQTYQSDTLFVYKKNNKDTTDPFYEQYIQFWAMCLGFLLVVQLF